LIPKLEIPGAESPGAPRFGEFKFDDMAIGSSAQTFAIRVRFGDGGAVTWRGTRISRGVGGAPRCVPNRGMRLRCNRTSPYEGMAATVRGAGRVADGLGEAMPGRSWWRRGVVTSSSGDHAVPRRGVSGGHIGDSGVLGEPSKKLGARQADVGGRGAVDVEADDAKRGFRDVAGLVVSAVNFRNAPDGGRCTCGTCIAR